MHGYGKDFFFGGNDGALDMNSDQQAYSLWLGRAEFELSRCALRLEPRQEIGRLFKGQAGRHGFFALEDLPVFTCFKCH
jgi:hypothetical protein